MRHLTDSHTCPKFESSSPHSALHADNRQVGCKFVSFPSKLEIVNRVSTMNQACLAQTSS